MILNLNRAIESPISMALFYFAVSKLHICAKTIHSEKPDSESIKPRLAKIQKVFLLPKGRQTKRGENQINSDSVSTFQSFGKFPNCCLVNRKITDSLLQNGDNL